MKNIIYILVFTLTAFGWNAESTAHADELAEVRNIQIGYDGDRTRLVIDATADLDFTQFPLSAGGMRYVLDFDRLTWAIPDQPSHQGEGEGAGGIQRFRFAHNSPSTSRLVLDLDQPLTFDSAFTMAPAKGSNIFRIVVDFRETDFETFKSIRPNSPVSATLSESANEIRLPAAVPINAKDVGPLRQLKKYVVVIDPGHGGHDPGSIGVSGTEEEDIVLSTALKLRDRLKKDARYEVVLTRDTDVYLDHEKRIEIARDAGADIFISIHADSIGRPNVSGASVYTLSSAGDRRVSKMIDEKGWSIPLEIEPTGDEAKEILQVLTARETLTKSATFANLLIPELEAVGPILRNTHRQANFYVLLAPDVPAVLLELGFLTNRNDEKRLKSPEGLSLAMDAVKRSIDFYFQEEEKKLASLLPTSGR